MTHLVNDARLFASDALDGFVKAHSERVIAVPGGVVRATTSPRGRVAVVMGGGSGHFPAFAGWVGPGLGSGAACGNIFSSPSQAQVASVARAADNGGGVLMVPINYAGDILHFGGAADQLRAEGIDVRMVPITDDIASGRPEERSRRRGIAGSFLVIKMVGAAAEEGQPLDAVEQVAIAANEATRSLGVAFSGCVLPGADSPLFSVPEKTMAIGLGIHGEPGISEAPLGTAADVADTLVNGLFEERAPVRGQRVAVLVNGLGTTSPDELHVLFARVKDRLEGAGMRLVAPVVGELVTSLDMAGVSLSLAYLDDELERLWLAPADAAFFSRGRVKARLRRKAAVPAAAAAKPATVPPATASSRAVAAVLAGMAGRVSDRLRQQEASLGAIDAVAGDGDHGACMVRGAVAAATEAQTVAEQGAGAGTLLARMATSWADAAGGTSGALWGAGLAAASAVVGDRKAPDSSTVVKAARAFREAVQSRGGAEPGDKTMIDAIVPFVDALARAVETGVPLAQAWTEAAQAASTAAEKTAELVARRGRSRTHGARSLGTPDPGATSFALVASAVVEP